MMQRWRLILSCFFLTFLAIQFIPTPYRNQASIGPYLAPKAVEEVLAQSCYDCHSHQTRWPWYSQVAPVAWFIAYDVNKGRQKLNFSQWESLSPEKKEKIKKEILKEIGNDEMPPAPYTWLHPEAQLTPEKKQLLQQWFGAIGEKDAFEFMEFGMDPLDH